MAENDFLSHSRGTCNSTIWAKKVIQEKWQREVAEIFQESCDSL